MGLKKSLKSPSNCSFPASIRWLSSKYGGTPFFDPMHRPFGEAKGQDQLPMSEVRRPALTAFTAVSGAFFLVYPAVGEYIAG